MFKEFGQMGLSEREKLKKSVPANDKEQGIFFAS
jgi:hypothetical protein